MRLNPDAMEKLRESKFTGESVARLCEELAKIGAGIGVEIPGISLEYTPTPDKVMPGDLMPVIRVALRPAPETPPEAGTSETG